MENLCKHWNGDVQLEMPFSLLLTKLWPEADCWYVSSNTYLFSGLGWQPFIFLPFSFLHSLGERFLSSLLSMKIMKTQKKELTAWFTRYWVKIDLSLTFSLFFVCQWLLLFMDLNSIAGVWSLFHAVIYRNLLPCPFTPQLFDSSHSLDSAPPCVWGENVKWVASY